MRRKLAGFVVAVVIGLASVALCGQSVAQSARSMTNENVIQMVRAGIPDTAIVASIARSTSSFDLSVHGLEMLKGAGVSEGVVRAMLEAAWKATSGTPGLGGTPSTNLGGGRPGLGTSQQTSQQMTTALNKIHAGKSKLSPVVTNPGAGQSNTATITTLNQQKQVALNERGQTGTPPSSPRPGSTASRMTSMRAPALAGVPPGNSATPNRTVATSANSISVPLACTTFNAPMISAVSGQQGSAIFTQDPAFNPFTIRGCNFGTSKGQAQLNSENGRKLASLTVDTWTDTLITVEVDPTLVDTLDQNNVTLVLFPANGPQAKKPGFRFYSKRSEILLASIPASEVSLGSINDDSGSPVTAKFSSPYSASGTRMSGGVDRYNVVRFPGGTDTFDFSKLKPGFVLEKYQVSELSNASCNDLGPTTTTQYTDGSWAWQMSGDTIRVTWMEAHCHDAYFGDASDASYGLNVWIVGPVITSATSPWQDGVQ